MNKIINKKFLQAGIFVSFSLIKKLLFFYPLSLKVTKIFQMVKLGKTLQIYCFTYMFQIPIIYP